MFDHFLARLARPELEAEDAEEHEVKRVERREGAPAVGRGREGQRDQGRDEEDPLHRLREAHGQSAKPQRAEPEGRRSAAGTASANERSHKKSTSFFCRGDRLHPRQYA